MRKQERPLTKREGLVCQWHQHKWDMAEQGKTITEKRDEEEEDEENSWCCFFAMLKNT